MEKRDWEKDWELCEKATPGPWKVDLEYHRKMLSGLRYFPAISGPNDEFIAPLLAPRYEDAFVSKDDAKFIAEAREALPYWLKRVRELEEENRCFKVIVEAAREFVEYCHHDHEIHRCYLKEECDVVWPNWRCYGACPLAKLRKEANEVGS